MNDRIPQSGTHSESVPVLISGAGPVGLVMPIFLSRLGIQNMVVEKRERIGTLPRPRGVMVRSVEILSQLRLGDELESIALPQSWTNLFIYTETLAGEIVGTMSTDAMKPGDVTLDLIARREQAGTATLVQEPQTARRPETNHTEPVIMSLPVGSLQPCIRQADDPQRALRDAVNALALRGPLPVRPK